MFLDSPETLVGMRPAMIVVWITGPLLGWQMGYLKNGWFWSKMACVLAAAHGQMLVWKRELDEDRSTRTPKFFQVMNEVPTLLMIAIVVKPF